MYKVIITGSKTFHDYNLLREFCNYALSNVTEPIEIVSGGANVADILGEQYAREQGYQLKQFSAVNCKYSSIYADWTHKGKAAGYIRNQEMANYADALIAFWDGFSKGTHHMIETAKQCKLNVRVKRFVA